MEQKVKHKGKKSWTFWYRFCLVALLLAVLGLMGWYCLSSYRQNAIPKEGTLVERVRQVGPYERKA